jgi:hypothetical protein
MAKSALWFDLQRHVRFRFLVPTLLRGNAYGASKWAKTAIRLNAETWTAPNYTGKDGRLDVCTKW